jgi:diacylglycerol kinase family enzyme
VQPAILIYNPKAGRGLDRRSIDALIRELSTDGPEVEAQATHEPGEATALARRAAGLGAPLVFALGGDGTLCEVAAGLLGTETVLGPLPGGTTNVVVQALGLPTSPLAAARELKTLPVRQLDVGLCGERPFLMQASLGLDAHIMDSVPPLAKRWLGRGAVGVWGAKAWLEYDYPEFEVLVDGHAVSATFAAVCNLPFYGGRIPLVPQARADDGVLDVLLFQGGGRRATAGFGRDLLAGRHLQRDDVAVLRASEIVLTDPDVPLQIDGDAVANRLGTEIRLATDRLRILAGSRIMGGR